MLTILFVVLLVLAGLLFAIWWSPKFKEKVAAKWGWIGAALLALATFVGSWFADAPVEIPPM